MCSAAVALTVNNVDLEDKPDVVVVLRDEHGDEKANWSQEMTYGDKGQSGGLGPDVKWAMVSHVGPEGSYDLEFTYGDDVTLNWLDFEVQTTSGAGDSYFESRTCTFPCRG